MAKIDHSPIYREFQKCTIRWCNEKLFGHKKSKTRRFLVADEVGLGKTIVARGIIDKLREQKPCPCIVYVCSSLDIINQNRTKLDPSARSSAYHSNRITLIRAYRSCGMPRLRLHSYFLTPGTSLFIANSTGMVEERLYMVWLVKKMFNIPTKRIIQVFECNAHTFGDKFSDVRSRGFKPLCQRNYTKLHRAWKCHAEDIRHGSRDSFKSTVKKMRLKLAKIMLESLSPDLIILDEFQKFKTILMPDTEINDEKNICSVLVRPDVPTLLLSATPYRLLSENRHSGSPDDISHYDEFLNVLSFLTGNPAEAKSLLDRIYEHGKRVRELDDATWRHQLKPLLKEKKVLESKLMCYMSRTERVFFQFEEVGSVITKFLSENKDTCRIKKDEIKEFLLLSKDVHKKELLAYWKSGAYLISYLQEYVLGKKLRRSSEIARDRFLYTKLRGKRARNRKIEYVAKDVFKNEEAYKYLWIPPLAPYYPGDGIYDPELIKRIKIKKGLIFSAWKFVPRQVAAELSSIRNQNFPRKFGKYQMKVTPVTWASFFFPSKKLAGCLSHDDFVQTGRYDKLRKLVRGRLLEIFKNCGITIREGKKTAKPWEILRHIEYSDDDVSWRELVRLYKKPVYRSRQNDEVKAGQLIETRYLEYLTKQLPENLQVNKRTIDKLVGMAISSPAVAMLRALNTIVGSSILESKDYMDELRQICLIELRSFISRSTTVQCARAAYKRGPYSHRVAEYFRSGNIQAVLDEFLFCVGGEINKKAVSPDEVKELLYKLRCVFQYHKSVLKPFKGRRARHWVNTHVAMVLGESQKEGVSRDDLRIAFNSPFWPFILATTSIGQEGLDFHLYCKDIYHWNLPSNPVDFEQREGRLNRFNSLTIREAVMSLVRSAPQVSIGDNTFWRRAFEEAPRRCHYNDRYNIGLSPNWICTPKKKNSNNQLVRHILDLPNSSDKDRYNKLMDRLRLYRLALGQPNPDSYLKQLEKKGYLKKIDTRSLYLNLFPFEAVDQDDRLGKLVSNIQGIRLMMKDAQIKAAELQKVQGRVHLQRLVKKAAQILQSSLVSDSIVDVKKPSLIKLIQAMLSFVDPHDQVNDRVPVIGYKDDLKRLKSAVAANEKNPRK